MGMATTDPTVFKELYTQYMLKVFHTKKPKKVVLNISFPFLVDVDWIIFSMATNMGTKPKNKNIVV